MMGDLTKKWSEYITSSMASKRKFGVLKQKVKAESEKPSEEQKITNIITGEKNSVSGTQVQVEGGRNKVIGKELDIVGNDNNIKGLNSTIIGDKNTLVKGKESII